MTELYYTMLAECCSNSLFLRTECLEVNQTVFNPLLVLVSENKPVLYVGSITLLIYFINLILKSYCKNSSVVKVWSSRKWKYWSTNTIKSTSVKVLSVCLNEVKIKVIQLQKRAWNVTASFFRNKPSTTSCFHINILPACSDFGGWNMVSITSLWRLAESCFSQGSAVLTGPRCLTCHRQKHSVTLKLVWTNSSFQKYQNNKTIYFTGDFSPSLMACSLWYVGQHKPTTNCETFKQKLVLF